jgi:8-oxo-dGTP diphosphatase
MEPIKYVVGFCFDAETENVALIKKNRPEWQAGRLNGVGGKIEQDETPFHAMVREFKEETGVLITEWEQYAVWQGANTELYYFRARTDEVYNVKTMESEEVMLYPVQNFAARNIIPNLAWAIPLALQYNLKMATLLQR